MGIFKSILIGTVASLVGVNADVTIWRTSTSTETAWSTLAPPASTVWSTETYTETSWSTYVPPAVTISIPYTVTSVFEKDYTSIVTSIVENDYTSIVTSTVENEYTTTTTETSVSVSVVASLATKYSEYTTTLTSVVISLTTVYAVQSGPTITQSCTPVTINQPTTITVPPITVTAPPLITTSSLTGLVTCPSRIINTAYTTSTPLPDDYTWGCPPEYICQPPQINCNFEQNPPADTYYCSPDECVPVPPLPSFNQTGCGPYQTASGYFNFDPELFGLSYSIFVDGGDYAETCSGCVMTTGAPVSQIYDGQPQAPTLVPVCQISDGQPQAPAPTPTPTTTWAPVSTISDGQPQGPVWTTAAMLARQQIIQPLPQVCYDLCNQCLVVAEHDAKQAKLCPSLSAAYGQCGFCLSAHRTDTRTAAATLLPSLDQFLDYCNDQTKAIAESTTPTHSTTSVATTSPVSTTTKSSTTSTSTTPTSTATKTSTTSTSTQSTPSSSPIPPISSSSPSSSSSSSATPPVPTSTPSSTTVSTATSSTISQPPAVTPNICAVSQISDGQPQACTNASTSAIATFTGAAAHTLSPPILFSSSPMGWALLLLVNALQL
jgi:hypothetical protein